MTSIAVIVTRGNRHWVRINWGGYMEWRGPYPWRWLARYVRWANDGVH